ncbi:hypothetical protein EV356DRAFT_501084 [Viridothelium virens]|uniref:F-box domain-containing protein n=1 Tax=Viridothelium virens TaxID=1048519 RepID=A0A6A6HBG5_VIRVR|nr:hypothetical protein EV356DRAFT_501084 [Viridothelium virens]
MHTLSLPPELLSLVYSGLPTIEDHINLSNTCHSFRSACQLTSPNAILRLAAAQNSIYIDPDPHFLILCCGRQLSSWALADASRTLELRDAFRDGVDGLLALCLKTCGLRIDDIRRMHQTRFRVLKPLYAAVAGMMPENEEGFVFSGAVWLAMDPKPIALQLLIYAELFRCDMDAVLYPGEGLPSFGYELRLEFVKYCIPDPMCSPPHPYLEVLETGPYKKWPTLWTTHNQLALMGIMRCPEWSRCWKSVMSEIGPQFSEPSSRAVEEGVDVLWEFYWKQSLWLSALIMQGIEGIDVMLTVSAGRKVEDVGNGKWRARLTQIRSQVEALKEAPQTHQFFQDGPRVSDAPYLLAEIRACVLGRVQ